MEKLINLKDESSIIISQPKQFDYKSILLKQEIKYKLINSNERVIVIDPLHEYTEMCSYVKGEIIKIILDEEGNIKPITDFNIIKNNRFIIFDVNEIYNQKNNINSNYTKILDFISNYTIKYKDENIKVYCILSIK